MEETKNVLLELSFEFALKIINYCELLNYHKKYIISNQLLRSGTSIGSNINEAQHPESRADFIHKLKIASKETAETNYWLKICMISKNYPDSSFLQDDLNSIMKLLSSIISKTKSNQKR